MTIPYPLEGEFPSYGTTYFNIADKTISALGLSSLRDLLVRQPGDLASLLADVSEQVSKSAYAEGKWTLLESLVHVSDSERVFAYRLLRAARGDRTELPGFEQDDWVPCSRANDRTLASVIAEFGSIRAATISLLDQLDQNELARVTRANGSQVSARALAWMIAGHAQHHFSIVESLYLARI